MGLQTSSVLAASVNSSRSNLSLCDRFSTSLAAYLADPAAAHTNCRSLSPSADEVANVEDRGWHKFFMQVKSILREK